MSLKTNMKECEVWVTQHAKYQILAKEQEKDVEFVTLLIGVVM